jgi:FMN phosphatase YigB (HAD superfamily)
MMAKAKVVSFDIFDTALRRKLGSPRHLFYVMEAMLNPRLGAIIPAFARCRIEAETVAWGRAKRIRKTQQITLSDILAVLKEMHHLTQEDVRALYELEIETEKRFTYANPMFLRFHANAREMGLKVIFLSDMYLPSVCLQTMLQSHGFSDPRVFVSSEEGGNKASGQLYRIVERKIGCPSADFIHFGDNYYADYLRPRWIGWRAVHVKSPCPAGPKEPRSRGTIRAGQIFAGAAQELICKNKIKNAARTSEGVDTNFWEDFGYEVVGPVYFYFLQWLCYQAEQDGVSRLLLCSRDGFPLLRGFEILRDKWKIPLETRYFYASRRLFKLATIREITSADVDFLLMPNPGLKLRDFVERLGFDPKTQEATLIRLGFTSLDQKLVHSGFGRFIDSSHRLRLGKWLDTCHHEFLMKVEEERKLVLEYLHEMHSSRNDTAVVDVGWKATVCVSISRLMREIDPSFRPKTYFFGTYEIARQLQEAGTLLKSFLFHLGEPSSRKKIVAGHEGVVEMLFHAPHGSINRLKRGLVGMEPIYGDCEYDKTMLQFLENMTTAAHGFVEDMADLPPPCKMYESVPGEIEKILWRLTRHPTLAEASSLGRISYRAGYGDCGTVQPLAKVAEIIPYSLLIDLLAYEQAPWKEAYLVQVSPARRLMLLAASFAHSVYIAITSKTLLVSIRWALFKH